MGFKRVAVHGVAEVATRYGGRNGLVDADDGALRMTREAGWRGR
jgi:hypothetical protein